MRSWEPEDLQEMEKLEELQELEDLKGLKELGAAQRRGHRDLAGGSDRRRRRGAIDAPPLGLGMVDAIEHVLLLAGIQRYHPLLEIVALLPLGIASAGVLPQRPRR